MLNTIAKNKRKLAIVTYPQALCEKVVTKSHLAKNSHWVRAPHSGSFRRRVNLGDTVTEGQVLAEISDPFGSGLVNVVAEEDGIVIGQSQIPLVNRGDAMFHLAVYSNTKKVQSSIDLFDEALI